MAMSEETSEANEEIEEAIAEPDVESEKENKKPEIKFKINKNKKDEDDEFNMEPDAGSGRIGSKKKKEEPNYEVDTSDKFPKIFSVRCTANREDQVADFLAANAKKKGLEVYSVIRAHGMRSYIFIETISQLEAEQAVFEVPYARGVLPGVIPYEEIEHMVETVKKEVNVQKGDIAEIISGPFKREKAKITKVDKDKEECVVELLESAVPIPITLKLDALKVIRRDDEEIEE